MGLNIVVFIFFKEFPPSDEELEAYRNGEVSQKSFFKSYFLSWDAFSYKSVFQMN